MDRETAREILRVGADVYYRGLMPRFSRWVEESFNGGVGGEFARFYLNEVGSINAQGGNSRMYDISLEVQESILEKYFSG